MTAKGRGTYRGVMRGHKVELEPGIHLSDGLVVEVRTEVDPPVVPTEDTFIERLRALGLITTSPTGVPTVREGWKPITVDGPPVSETIIADRQ